MAEVAPNILLWVEGDDKRRTVTLRMAKKSYTARTRRELAELIGLIDSLSQAMKEHLSSYYGESSYDGPSEANRTDTTSFPLLSNGGKRGHGT